MSIYKHCLRVQQEVVRNTTTGLFNGSFFDTGGVCLIGPYGHTAYYIPNSEMILNPTKICINSNVKNLFCDYDDTDYTWFTETIMKSSDPRINKVREVATVDGRVMLFQDKFIRALIRDYGKDVEFRVPKFKSNHIIAYVDKNPIAVCMEFRES